ncbi:ABC transporter substrate-binding protein [Photobacterium leiognathi]|uniref:Phosphoglycerate transport regulatory protein PgtC n=1 Tax=Photobacterium leiognathi lrivu.4.1 TaxID=1248232 RepID=X0P7N5_PHOLE|nr:ABC transporter substrate-binding protein [Photobacterium leiognathi]GAD28858.1 phosphoglycerate transport regulatory protein PgtC [Photobacterium leiognathi lrivu.4.1]
MLHIFILLLVVATPIIAQATPNLVILTTFSEEGLSPIIDRFKEEHPQSNIKVIQRREASGLRFLDDQKKNIDIIISSSPTFFQPLINSQQLLPFGKAKARKEQQQLSEDIIAFGHTGFGLLWNQRYLTNNNLPTPKTWLDLAKPDFFRHISISSPYRSNTTHLMIESILQEYGWENGWRLLYQMGGNLASVETNAFALSEAISRGLIGVGPVIDSYARHYKEQFSYIDFSYQPKSPLLPNYVAIVKNNYQSRFAEDFVNLLLAQECDNQTATYEHLIHPKQIKHDDFIKKTFNRKSLDYHIIQQRSGLVKHLFEQTISNQLPKLNQAWQLLHSIEKASLKLTEKQQQDFTLAKQLASTSPVNIDDMQDKVYHELSLFRDNPQVHNYRQQWRIKMAMQLEQAIALSQTIINGNPALQ